MMPTTRPKVISFSGIDGAGKSTQIEALQRRLRELDLRSTVYTFWDDVVALPRLRESLSHRVFKGDPGVGSPENPISRRDKNVQSWYATAVRLVLYVLDALSLRFMLARASRCAVDFIILDRYIYDELANLPLDSPGVRLYVEVLLWLSPEPEIAYLVDADPEVARARKPEYPLEFLRRNRDAYLALSRRLGTMFVIEPGDVEAMNARMVRRLWGTLSPEISAPPGAVAGTRNI
jgi:thymidylate kinase